MENKSIGENIMATENVKKYLDNIKKQAVDVPKTERESKTIEIPLAIAQEFLNQANARKDKGRKFSLPIDSTNEAVGFKSAKNRTSSLEKKLNKQHGNLIAKDEQWKVGTADKGKLYKIQIVKKEAEKEEPEALEDA